MQLHELSRARVLVAGDLMLDRYWHGATSRISPEAPVPVVRVDQIEERVGGAGNVALNIARLGGMVDVLGYCGQDEAGSRLLMLLNQAGIRCRVERLEQIPTITKLRVLSRHQQLIRLDFEQPFQPQTPDTLLRSYCSALALVHLVVLSDYGKGTLASVTALIEQARQAGCPVLVDPKGTDFSRYRGARLVTPNRSEFEAVVGVCQTEDELVTRGLALLQRHALEALLITRGEQGMTLLEPGQLPLHLPAHAKEVYDVTGAGDTVIAVLAIALAAGVALADATRLANLAAGLVVGKLGTASVTREELEDALEGSRAHRHGIVDWPTLQDLLKAARVRGEKIVATNGCFDLLHPGHIHYLRQARSLGDRLVVLVNTDASVTRLKGPERPINPLEHRMEMLAALESVDWVIAFDQDTPAELIGQILPDVLVKGGDYPDITRIAGYAQVMAHGGIVKVLDYVSHHSTTRLIETIRKR
ncbi:bifunctional D-glycero-beta-D-manno-heptose-7-phosphate kinase/D-glycero-beta-D-manno-heptose 1-phosphate adenylyltransferase HldE [Candidatus Woesearchaeota archaeon]|nr:bifunctional D-glycero-beta-D-manno-heptose-7-phosphate kinase/D-glycero-beta-D-manno-heptose 1-phosphate adenylyltransferase HldE [Candidatus Woesearchaeota archaeon]